MSNLIQAWQQWHQDGAAGVLCGDEVLKSPAVRACDIRSWDSFVRSDQVAGSASQLHLGLLPMPYVGSLATARVFVLLLNPGLEPIDYFGEYRVPEYRAAVEDCLLQNPASDARGFYFLDPAMSWCGGFRYWHKKLLRVAEKLAERREMSLVEAFAFVRRHFAAIELVPYHSAQFGLSERVVRGLGSVRLAQEYVRTVVLPKAARGEATVIVIRQATRWGLAASGRVVVYGGGEAHAAHLTPSTRGGRAILDAMLEVTRTG